MGATICFSSDFGLGDTWVGVCRAVIHDACPDAYVVDLSHQIPPYDVRSGSVLAAQGAYQLPQALHLVVVDPGVGGQRRDLCVVSGAGTRLVGPDNGVLVPAAVRTGGIAEAYELRARDTGREPLATFHARDVLAPAIAALACGEAPRDLGAAVPIESLAPAPFEIARVEGTFLIGEVLGPDHFGSLRTSITSDDVDAAGAKDGTLEVSIGHVSLAIPFRSTFEDVPTGDLVALLDSSGWLTLAQNRGSAVERLGVEPGAHVRVRVLS